ncbi:hypothetical protein D3C80_594950 [compost metagenome]
MQRYRVAVLQPAGAQTNEALARLLYRTRHQRLQAIEVRELIGISLINPVLPQLLHHLADRLVEQPRVRRDAGTDQVADALVDDVGGVRVIAHRAAGAGTQVTQGRHDQAVHASIRRIPV